MARPRVPRGRLRVVNLFVRSISPAGPGDPDGSRHDARPPLRRVRARPGSPRHPVGPPPSGPRSGAEERAEQGSRDPGIGGCRVAGSSGSSSWFGASSSSGSASPRSRPAPSSGSPPASIGRGRSSSSPPSPTSPPGSAGEAGGRPRRTSPCSIAAPTPISARRSWLVEPIREGRGEANVGATLWPVRGADLPAGARVVVVGERDGAARVEPAEAPP